VVGYAGIKKEKNIMKVITKSPEETKKMGSELASKLNSGDSVLLYGDLGAGKTTFVQGLAAGLGIKDRILSPTFVLHRVHEVKDQDFKTLNHIDLYRIDEPTKIESLGLSELFEDEGSVTLVEWADRIKDFTPNKGYKILLKYLSNNQREIEIEKLK
jgi:tRNA threonylcarbamoyladenosine biosynthesis protein TsaE